MSSTASSDSGRTIFAGRHPIPEAHLVHDEREVVDGVPAGFLAHQRVRAKRRVRGEGAVAGDERAAGRVRGERTRRARDATARGAGNVSRVGGGGSSQQSRRDERGRSRRRPRRHGDASDE
jgi:hypothetical protein